MNILRRLYLSTAMLLFLGGLSFNQVNATFFNRFSKGNGHKKLTSGEYQLKRLHLAAETSDVEQIEVLIQRGVCINDILEDKTALQRAVSSNSIDTAKFLLQNEADPNKYGAHNLLPLCLVLNNVGMAQLLIDYRAYVNASAYGYTPLHSAAEHNAYEVAELLIKSGANVNAQEPIYTTGTPLHVAAKHNAYEVAKLLIENNAYVSALSRGYTPLHVAAEHNAYEVAKLLIENDVNVNALAHGHTTPLHSAAKHNAYEVAELLIRSGANVNASERNYKPLCISISARSHLCMIVGRDVNAQEPIYMTSTPLHVAAKHNAYEVAKLLIENDADMSVSSCGYTPLHGAAKHNAYEVAELLIKNGADVNASVRRYTPLHGAAEYDAYEVAELLIKNGADVNASVERYTPLHFAVAGKSSKKLIKLLRNSGTKGNWSRIKREASEPDLVGCSIM